MSIYKNRARPTLSNKLPEGFKTHRLDAQQIKDLVTSVDAGFGAPANLEFSKGAYRLRLTINKAGGGSVRRGFQVPDEETAKWIQSYLDKARERWLEAKREDAKFVKVSRKAIDGLRKNVARDEA